MIAAIRSTWNTKTTHLWVPLFLAITAFAIPISSTGKSIAIVIALALIIYIPTYRRDLMATLQQSWCKALLLLFFLAVIACCWSPAHFSEKMLVLEKYSKLLYLPLLVVGFRDANTRRASLYAFLLAMSLTCFISMFKAGGFLNYHGPESDFVFRNHIMTGHMMVFATYLSALFLLREQGWVKIVYAALVGLFSYQILYISTGRTGYVIYLLLMALLLIQYLSWEKALLGILLGCSLFTVSYYQSPTMHASVGNAITDLQQYHKNDKNTHIGHRLQFHDYAKSLFYRHPLIGNGTASFTYLFQQEKPVPSWPRKLLEPHSQYWLVAVEFGAVGLLLLFYFFGSLVWASWKLHSMRAIALALIIPFFIGNLSDSLLFYSGSGYFFIFFMALCLGERSGVDEKGYSS